MPLYPLLDDRDFTTIQLAETSDEYRRLVNDFDYDAWVVRLNDRCRRSISDLWTYALREEGRGYIKIGRTQNPERRVKDYVLTQPHDIEVLAVSPGNCEPVILGELNFFLIRHEWFHPHPYVMCLVEALRRLAIARTDALAARPAIVREQHEMVRYRRAAGRPRAGGKP